MPKAGEHPNNPLIPRHHPHHQLYILRQFGRIDFHLQRFSEIDTPSIITVLSSTHEQRSFCFHSTSETTHPTTPAGTTPVSSSRHGRIKWFPTTSSTFCIFRDGSTAKSNPL